MSRSSGTVYVIFVQGASGHPIGTPVRSTAHARVPPSTCTSTLGLKHLFPPLSLMVHTPSSFVAFFALQKITTLAFFSPARRLPAISARRASHPPSLPRWYGVESRHRFASGLSS